MSAPSYNPLEGSDKYRAIKELGRGGMGEVFLAEHLALGTKVVIKLLHAELSDKTTLVDRMRLEAQACARLNHPNIVRVTDFERSPAGRPYFVMEYLPGRSLRDEVDARGGFLPVLEAIELVQQALAGLAAAHGAGMVHRDIKLDNLFLCDASPQSAGKRLLKILDFGVAKVLDGASDAPAPLMVPTSTGVVVGTPRFFAPEQARGKPLDHRADIYAMGLVLYSLLSGRGPFDEATTITDMAKAHVFKKPDPPSRWAKQPIPDRLDAIVLRAIAKQPEQRFQSATEFAAMLSRAVEQAPAAHAQAASPPLAKTAYLPPEEEAPAPPPPTAPPSAQPASAPVVPTHDMTGHAHAPPYVPPPAAPLAAPPPRDPTHAWQPAPPAIPQAPLRPVGPKRYSAAIAATIVLAAGLLGAAVAAVAMRFL